MSAKRKLTIVAGVVLLSALIQFLSWAFASGNTAGPVAGNSTADVVYRLSSLPLSLIARALDIGFWPVALLNGVIWGAVILFVIKLFGTLKFKRSARSETPKAS
jgi:hypothetical protein